MATYQLFHLVISWFIIAGLSKEPLFATEGDPIPVIEVKVLAVNTVRIDVTTYIEIDYSFCDISLDNDTKTYQSANFSSVLSFSGPGIYSVSIKCVSFQLYPLSYSKLVYIGNAIESVEVMRGGLKHIFPVSYPLESDIEVNVTLQGGVNVLLTLFFLHSRFEIRYNNFSSGTRAINISKTYMPEGGIYIIKYMFKSNYTHGTETVENSSEDAQATAYSIFFVQPRVAFNTTGRRSSKHELKEAGIFLLNISTHNVNDWSSEIQTLDGNERVLSYRSNYCPAKMDEVHIRAHFQEGDTTDTCSVHVAITNLVHTDYYTAYVSFAEAFNESYTTPGGEKQSINLEGIMYFEPTFAHPENSKLVLTSSKIELAASLDLSSSKSMDYSFEFDWRLYLGTSDVETAVEYSGPTESATIVIEANTLDLGLYRVVLDVCVIEYSERKCKDDFMYLEIVAPQLAASIRGSRKRMITYGDGPFILDASESHDPAGDFPSVRKLPMVQSWSCITAEESIITDSLVNVFLANNDDIHIANGYGNQGCSGHADNKTKSFTLDPSSVRVNRWYLVCYSLTRGNRLSRYCVALKVIYWSVPVISIKCINNCFSDTCRKNRHDGIQLDVDIGEDAVNTSSVIYKWSLRQWIAYENKFTASLALPGNSDDIGLRLPKSMLDPGQQYLISVDVSVPGMVTGTASDVYTINLPPHGGNCSVDKTNGTAALDLFCVICQDWEDDDSRAIFGSDNDSDRFLHYDVHQIVDDATVLKYTLVENSDKQRNCFYLNQGHPASYETQLQVKVKDTCKDSYLWETSVIVYPPFDTTANPTFADANRTDVLIDFVEEMESRIQIALSIQNITAILNLISTLFSVFQDKQVPENKPLLDITLQKSSLGIIDVDPETDNVVTAEEALGGLLRTDITNNMTYMVQQVKEKHSNILEQMIRKAANGGQTQNAMRLAHYAEVMALVLGKYRGTETNATKETILLAMTELGKAVDKLPMDDPETAETMEVMVHLLGKAIITIVPEDMQTIIGTVQDFKTARQYNDALFHLAKEEAWNRREMADMTPDERAFLLYKLQEKSSLLVDQTRMQVWRVISFMDDLMKTLTKLNLCTGCGLNYGNAGINITLERHRALTLSQKQIEVGNSTLTVEMSYGLKNHSVTVIVCQVTKNPYLSALGETNIAAFVKAPALAVFVENVQDISFGDIVFTQKIRKQHYHTINPSIDEADASQMAVAITWKGFERDRFCISIKMSAMVSGYWVYVKLGSRPTIIDYDSKQYFSLERKSALCFSTGKAGLLFYGVRADAKAIQAAEVGEKSPKRHPSYKIAVANAACLSYSKAEEQWDNENCELQWIPDQSIVRCSCKNPMNLIFTNSFDSSPNKIDLSTVFLRFSPLDQAAVLATLSSTAVIYVVVLIWARRQDQKDNDKWAIRPLTDCAPVDNYYYLMRVYTGKRPGAGTTSRVGFLLMGQYVEETATEARVLSDGYLKGFPTGSVRNFMLSTSRCHGRLEYMRIWHDNSGNDHKASWYLSKIEIIDVQTQESYIFKAERWLAVDGEACGISCTLPVAVEESSASLRKCFVSHLEETFHDEHLWLSVFYRPSPSNFSRTQRWSCGLVFILTTMLADAMFFRVGENYETAVPLKLGPFRFSLQQVYISAMCALITTPTLLLAFMFRLSKKKICNRRRPRGKSEHKINRTPFDKEGDSERERIIEDNGDISFAEVYTNLPFRFPSWIRSLAWVTVAVAMITSSLFIVLYSMEWGRQKSEQWLTAFFIAFFNSVFIMDTIRVTLVGALFTFLCNKKAGPSITLERSVILAQYPTCLRLGAVHEKYVVPILGREDVKEARLSRERELKIRKSVVDIFVTVFLIVILFGISYSNRDERSYYLYNDIAQRMISSGNHDRFENIKSTNDYFQWLKKAAIPSLFPEKDVNKERLHWRMREFMEGGVFYRMGPPRLRQLRAKTRTCTLPHMGTLECTGSYQVSDQDVKNYCIGWKDTPCDPKDKTYKFSNTAWQYTSPSVSWDSFISGSIAHYNDGGYICRLDVNRDVSIRILDELYRELWLDKRTRAVTLEFTLYNANVNMFVYNVFMVEFAETGGVLPFFMIFPVRLHQHSGQMAQYTMIFEITILMFILTSFAKTMTAIWKQKLEYFTQSEKLVNVSFLLLGLVAIAFYVNRLCLSKSALSEFKKNPDEFVNLYKTAFWDLVFVACLGFLDFVAFTKLVVLLGYSKRIGTVVKMVASSSTELIWFCILFSYFYLAYAVYGYLLFGTSVKSYMSLYKSLSTLFLSSIGKSKFSEIHGNHPIMSKIYFMVFIFVVVYLILTMFVSVWTACIHEARLKAKDRTDEEIIQYIISALKSMFAYRAQGRNVLGRLNSKQS